MTIFTTIRAAIAVTSLAFPAFAGDIMIDDAYARASSPNAKVGGAFMTIMNNGDTADRLIAVSTDIAARAELHTHIDAGNGVMQMREVEEGFVVPAQGMHLLMRGGDHVMLMGLNQSLFHGDTVELILTFEQAGNIAVTVPVDLERPADHSMNHDN